jgi:hypothetical protein
MAGIGVAKTPCTNSLALNLVQENVEQ